MNLPLYLAKISLSLTLVGAITLLGCGQTTDDTTSVSTVGGSAGSTSPPGSEHHGGGGAGGSSGAGGVSETSGAGGSIILPGTGGTGGSGGAAPCGNAHDKADCMTDADCNDDNPSTTDKCYISGGEFPTHTCVYSQCSGPDCVLNPIDTACNDSSQWGGKDLPIAPYVPLSPPSVPAECHNGFQTSNRAGSESIILHSLKLEGSRKITLDIDLATYTMGDGITIVGVDSCGKEYVLFETCRIRTGDKSVSAYTKPDQPRPDDIAIRQFKAELRAGTTELRVDFSRVVSPMYLQVLGLCDFEEPTPTKKPWLELVP